MGPDVDVSTLDGLANQLLGKAHTRAVSVTTSVLEIGVTAVVLTVALQIGPAGTASDSWSPGPDGATCTGRGSRSLSPRSITAGVTLVRPRWTRFRVASHLAIDLAVIVLGIVSLGLGNWVLLADPATATAQEVDVVNSINTIVRISFAATVVLTAVTAGLELRRLLRMRES